MMGGAKTWLPLLIAAFVIASATLAVASPAAAGDSLFARNNAATQWVAAPTCCVGCSYPAGCCCAAVKGTATKTVTPTVTRTATVTGNTLKGRAFEAAEPMEESVEAGDAPAVVSIVDRQVASADGAGRHLCPACPAGVALAKNNGGSGAKYCCPGRKTITKTASVKKTVTTTKTVSPTGPAAVQGRVYVDVNGNRQWDAGIDLPIGNTALDLLRNAPTKKANNKRAGGGTVVSQTTSNAYGQFWFYGVNAIPGEILDVVMRSDPTRVLASVTITGSGTGNANIPFDVAQPVCVNSTVTTTSTLKMTPTGGPAPTVTMTKTLTQTPTCAGQTTATERCTADFGVFTKFDVVTYTDTTSETTEFSTGTTVRSAWSPIYTGIYNTWTDTLYSTSTISTSTFVTSSTSWYFPETTGLATFCASPSTTVTAAPPPPS